jgi:histidyl-tRNA synthetase
MELREDQADPIISFMLARSTSNDQTLRNLRGIVGASKVGAQGIDEWEAMVEQLDAAGNRVVIDPSVVRGLG